MYSPIENFIFTAMGLMGERVIVKGGTFMQSSNFVCQAMGLCLVILVSLVKLHNTVDPNFEITTHSLKYKKNGEK